MIGGPRRINVATVQAASDRAGVQQLLAALGYDTSELSEQTAASLGVAERSQHLIRNVCRVAAERLSPGLPPALEVYCFETTGLTVELRKALVAAFRNKPANALLIAATRDFDPLDFVLVEKAVQAGGPGGARVAVSHRLISVDRRHPSGVHLRVLERMSRTATDPFGQFERIRDAFRLAEWSEDEFNNRGLFSDYFLKSRLSDARTFPVWNTDLRGVHHELASILAQAGDAGQLSSTKDMHARLVKPTLTALGFKADALDEDDEADFLLRPADSAADSSAVAALLAYPWDRPLDRQDDLNRDRAAHVPGIRVVGALEKHKVPWAILTNGKDWRLYCAAAHSRASNYYEVELPEALARDDLVALRYFWLFFRAAAFAPLEPAAGEPSCFLDQVRLGSQAFAKEVGDRLRGRIFDEVFPYLAEGFVQYRRSHFDEKTDADDEFLGQAYDATLTLLYRLLFLLYTESLDLLPVHEPAYAAASLMLLKQEVDASVLGEAINPKVFNTIKRIENEDETVIDEEEAEAELASDEGLIRHLAEFIKASGTQILSGLPDGIHSGKHAREHRGVFLYYQRRGELPANTEHYWRFYDTASGEIEDNRLAIAGLIRCKPDEPRLVDPDLKSEIHLIMEIVEDSIVDTVQHQETIQTAPKELSSEQSAVVVALQQALGSPGIDRARVLNLLTALSQPILSAPVKEARQAMLRLQRGGDVETFLSVCESVAEKYAPKAPITMPGTDQNPSSVLKKEDLRLVCFEFLS